MIESPIFGLDQLSFLIMGNGGNIHPKEIAVHKAKTPRWSKSEGSLGGETVKCQKWTCPRPLRDFRSILAALHVVARRSLARVQLQELVPLLVNRSPAGHAHLGRTAGNHPKRPPRGLKAATGGWAG